MSSVWYISLFQIIIGVVFFAVIGIFDLAKDGIKLENGEGMKIFHSFTIGIMFAVWFFISYGKL